MSARAMRSRPSAYLCGPITGCTFEEAKHGWRQDVHEALDAVGIDCLSPMRSVVESDYHEEQLQDMDKMGSAKSVLAQPRGLTRRDKFDTMRSDIIFCNLLGARKISAGSMIEFGWADALQIPVLLCMEQEGNPNDHAMVRELISWHTTTLEEGIEIAKRVLLLGL